MQGRKIRRTRRSGFTLLEILIVVGIIALLAAFVVPNFVKTQQGANEKLTKSAVDGNGPIATALNLFRMDMGVYPKELKELTEKPEGDDAAKWKGPYLQDASKLKDAWNNDIQYRFPGQFKGEENFDLWSKGPDGQDGTEDDITNWPKQ
jgi:general secretion pathway protein G